MNKVLLIICLFFISLTQANGIDKFYQTVLIGDNHTLALKSNGELYAWGSNEFGQLGTGDTNTTYKPLRVGGMQTFEQIAVGTNHSLAIGSDGHLYGWGENLSGQLGTGDTIGRNIPLEINSEAWSFISARGDYSMAIKSDGTLWATGKNNYGQL